MSKSNYDREKAREVLNAAKKVTASCEFLFKKTGTDPVTIFYADLLKLPFGERTYVGPGIWMTKIDSAFFEGIMFLVEMADGSQFDLHDHDCYEWFKVVKGAIMGIDTEVFYDPGQAHAPEAVGLTLLLVRISQNPMLK